MQPIPVGSAPWYLAIFAIAAIAGIFFILRKHAQDTLNNEREEAAKVLEHSKRSNLYPLAGQADPKHWKDPIHLTEQHNRGCGVLDLTEPYKQRIGMRIVLRIKGIPDRLIEAARFPHPLHSSLIDFSSLLRTELEDNPKDQLRREILADLPLLFGRERSVEEVVGMMKKVSETERRIEEFLKWRVPQILEQKIVAGDYTDYEVEYCSVMILPVDEALNRIRHSGGGAGLIN